MIERKVAMTKKATAKAKSTTKSTAAKPARVTKTTGTAKIIDAAVSKNGGKSTGLDRAKILTKMQKDLDMTPGQSSTYYHNYLRSNFTSKGARRKNPVSASASK
jgi:hypothetical protein